MENKINVFFSYRHIPDDEMILDEIRSYISMSLAMNNAETWIDKNISPGDEWDKKIKDQLSQTDIVLALISQHYLSSEYILNTEIPIMENRKKEGLIIFPIILSPCMWKDFNWLSQTQFLPRNGKTIETDYTDKGTRKTLYKEITENLIAIISRIKNIRLKIESEFDHLQCNKCRYVILIKENVREQVCPKCNSLVETPLSICINDKKIYLTTSTKLYPYHFNFRKYLISHPIAEVSNHPLEEGVWGLKNVSKCSWTRVTKSGEKTVKPGQTVLLTPGIKLIFDSGMEGNVP